MGLWGISIKDRGAWWEHDSRTEILDIPRHHVQTSIDQMHGSYEFHMT